MATFRYLDLSTAHITRGDDELLARWDGYPTVAPHGHGYLVNVPTGDRRPTRLRNGVARELRQARYSEGFIEVLRRAARRRCYWVNLDCDAALEKGLATLQW